MTVSDKLNQLIQVKSDLKAVLKAKGLITDATVFSAYPEACQKLSNPYQEPVYTNTQSFTIKLELPTNSIWSNQSRALIYMDGPLGSHVDVLGFNYYRTRLKDTIAFNANATSINSEYNPCDIALQVPKSTPLNLLIRLYLGFQGESNPSYLIKWGDLGTEWSKAMQINAAPVSVVLRPTDLVGV